MGIPGLFAWLRANAPHTIKNLPNSKNVLTGHNNLCLDMNGIFHEACQKVYCYGNYAKMKSKVHKEPALLEGEVQLSESQMRRKVFEEVGKIMNNLVYKTRPSKRVLVMVDGPAGAAKCSQQRQRRYRSAQDTEKKFDSNCISPGTEWMDFLSKFLDHFIRRQITTNPIWKNLQVIFSNSNSPGEGEHKVINFIRRHGSPNESYVVYGLDADLIMLTLSIQNILSVNELKPPKFHILREDQYNGGLLTIDISVLRQFLIEELTWGLECSRNNLIDDFIFLCFLLGNDFLPHSPTVDLIEGGIELLFDSYAGACSKYDKHLMVNGKFNTDVLKDILYNISMSERIILEDTIKRGDKFADPLLQKYIKTSVKTRTGTQEETHDEVKCEAPLESPQEFSLNFDLYKAEYYSTKFPRCTMTDVCHEYFHGMEWVYKYYTTGIPSWSWKYPFFYAPFSKEMCSSLDTYVSKPFKLDKPLELFKQLLSILPPQSKYLLPPQFHSLMDTFPSEAKVDLAGKKFDWQGVVLTPPLPDFETEYQAILSSMTTSEKRRNFLGKAYVYSFQEGLSYEYKSYYGTFVCSTSVAIFA